MCSQGAQLVHRSFEDQKSNFFTPMAPSSISKIAGLVLFGDPDKNKPIPGITTANTDTICADEDLICDGLPLPGPAHLTYAEDAVGAAEFVLGKINI